MNMKMNRLDWCNEAIKPIKMKINNNYRLKIANKQVLPIRNKNKH